MALTKPQAIGDLGDMRPALLQFMVAATPHAEVVTDILSKYDQHLEKMSISGVMHFASEEQPNQLLVHDVPDTVNPVKAHLAYVQVPSEDGSVDLTVVWKVCYCVLERLSSVDSLRSSRLKWKTTGMKRLSLPSHPTGSSRS